MKKFILLLIVFSSSNVSCQCSISNCNVDNPYKFILDIVPTVLHEPGDLKAESKDGQFPSQCKAYKLQYKKNGKLKDSTLYKIYIWNTDGTFSSVIQYDRKGEIWNTVKYRYEKIGKDSIITKLSSFYGNSKYYLNKSNLVYKYERSYSSDTNFNSIKERITYAYDEKGNFLEAVVSFPGSKDRIWKWEYDQKNFTAKQFIDDNLRSTAKLNVDSCYVEVVYTGGGNPTKSKYYFDPNGRNCKATYYYNTKKGMKTSTLYYDWNSIGQMIRIYGSDMHGESINDNFSFNSNGLKTREESPLWRQVITYHYSFEN